MTNRFLLALCSISSFAVVLLGSERIGTANDDTKQKINFVFILVDDLGARDLGCYGSTYYETPNIDALAKSSVLFTSAYAAGSVCSPTRAAIMTGKYSPGGESFIVTATPFDRARRRDLFLMQRQVSAVVEKLQEEDPTASLFSAMIRLTSSAKHTARFPRIFKLQ